MNKLASSLLASALMCTATMAFAHDDTPHHGMHSHMASMDTNGDGLISKEEFMAFHQTMWDKLPKNKDGMVSMKDLENMHHDRMMKHDGMMKPADEKQTKDGGN